MMWYIICVAFLQLNKLQAVFGAEYSTHYHYDVIFVDNNKMALIEGDTFPMTLNGEKYQCKIPSREIYSSEELLYSIYSNKVNNMSCLGWFDGREWLYVFCPKTGVTQIHITHTTYSLGSKYTDYFKENEVNDFYGSKFSLKLVRNYTEGDICKRSGRNRSSVVKFVCDPFGEDRIVLLSEIHTCEYAVEVKTRRVCFNKDIAGIPIFCGSEENVYELVLKKFEWYWIHEKLLRDSGKDGNDSFFKYGLLPHSNECNKVKFGEEKQSSDSSYPNYFYYAEDVMLASSLDQDESMKSVYDLIDIFRITPIENNPLNLSTITTLRKNLNFKEGLKLHLNILLELKILKDAEYPQERYGLN